MTKREYEITCERCGKVLTSHSKVRKLCDDCRKAAYSERHRRFREAHRDELLARRKEKRGMERAKKNIPDTIKCADCGVEMPYKPLLKYCPECSVRRNRERARGKAVKSAPDAFPECPRQDCFACCDGRCSILTRAEPEKCSFYKTKAQFEADIKKCYERTARLKGIMEGGRQ